MRSALSAANAAEAELSPSGACRGTSSAALHSMGVLRHECYSGRYGARKAWQEENHRRCRFLRIPRTRTFQNEHQRPAAFLRQSLRSSCLGGQDSPHCIPLPVEHDRRSSLALGLTQLVPAPPRSAQRPPKAQGPRRRNPPKVFIVSAWRLPEARDPRGTRSTKRQEVHANHAGEDQRRPREESEA